ncbi:MAG: hypothetical protein IJ124_00640, partial [Clostridia bacterium]|nr:hypothetical protein [Clostridia bacterium]
MTRKTTLRMIALALCLVLTVLPGLGEEAYSIAAEEATLQAAQDIVIPMEAPVEEQAEFALAPEVPAGAPQ